SRLQGINKRAYYRWILELPHEGPAIMTYTRGHSAELTLPAQMNWEADHYTSGAQKSVTVDLVPHAPTPTFSMDSFTFHTIVDGWIESNTRSFANFFLATGTASKLTLGNRMCMLTWVHDITPLPNHPYTCTLSVHSAVIQLYVCSGQLLTAETQELRSKLDSCLCRLGCCTVESMHHIFVDCPRFAEWRKE
ncbi:hypothetical protein B0H14DRAFT_2249938, partial [Mycena olivaceomarginata]